MLSQLWTMTHVLLYILGTLQGILGNQVSRGNRKYESVSWGETCFTPVGWTVHVVLADAKTRRLLKGRLPSSAFQLKNCNQLFLFRQCFISVFGPGSITGRRNSTPHGNSFVWLEAKRCRTRWWFWFLRRSTQLSSGCLRRSRLRATLWGSKEKPS